MIWLYDYESQDIIYILFSIFYYRQKIYKDFDEKENDGINGNKEISSGSSEKKQGRHSLAKVTPSSLPNSTKSFHLQF
jgi:hypothetical protein